MLTPSDALIGSGVITLIVLQYHTLISLQYQTTFVKTMIVLQYHTPHLEMKYNELSEWLQSGVTTQWNERMQCKAFLMTRSRLD